MWCALFVSARLFFNFSTGGGVGVPLSNFVSVPPAAEVLFEHFSPPPLEVTFLYVFPPQSTPSGVIGKSTKFGFEWKWPLMGKK
jgi:hypothetical protein